MLTKCRRLFFESVPLLESESNWQYVQVDFPISVACVFSCREKIDASSLGKQSPYHVTYENKRPEKQNSAIPGCLVMQINRVI